MCCVNNNCISAPPFSLLSIEDLLMVLKIQRVMKRIVRKRVLNNCRVQAVTITKFK